MANRIGRKKQIPRSTRNDKASGAVSPNEKARRAGSARTDELLYLYGISDRRSDVRVAEGVDGRAAVEAIECDGRLVCWVSRVDAREFGAELQIRMENLDWLAGASVRHQRVVAAIHEKTTVLPARFATLFLSEATLAAHVQRSLKQIRADLKRVEGADEYGIKIFAEPRTTAPPPAVGSGQEYLRRKSLMLKQASAPVMTPELHKFVTELEQIASASAPGGSVSGGQRNLLWQASLLVARSGRRRLESALARIGEQGRGFRVECTGPWPPYSFIAVKAEQK